MTDSGKSRIHEIINSLAALVTAIGTLYAIYLAGTAKNTAVKAGQEAANNALTEQQQKMGKNDTTTHDPDNPIVQLATYLAINCNTAQSELDSYKNKFNPSPQLWLAQKSRFVVIGIKAKSNEEADRLKEEARKLASSPELAVHDLQNAVIRNNTNWKQISSCQEIPS